MPAILAADGRYRSFFVPLRVFESRWFPQPGWNEVVAALRIRFMAGLAVALIMSHSPAHAEASGCVAREAMMEDQEVFTSELPPVAEVKVQHKVKKSKPPSQHMDDRGSIISTRERAFALGQDLSVYCPFKVETRAPIGVLQKEDRN